MSHLGHRLSALVDGELDGDERDRVLVHLARCTSCRSEVIALRTLKRRMSALGGAAADTALTRRLIGLAQQDQAAGGYGYGQPVPAAALPSADWPQVATAAAVTFPLPQQRPGWYLGASALVLLASLGTAVFTAAGTAQRSGPRVSPVVDTYYARHQARGGPARPVPADRDVLPAVGRTASLLRPASGALAGRIR